MISDADFFGILKEYLNKQARIPKEHGDDVKLYKVKADMIQDLPISYSEYFHNEHRMVSLPLTGPDGQSNIGVIKVPCIVERDAQDKTFGKDRAIQQSHVAHEDSASDEYTINLGDKNKMYDVTFLPADDTDAITVKKTAGEILEDYDNHMCHCQSMRIMSAFDRSGTMSKEMIETLQQNMADKVSSRYRTLVDVLDSVVCIPQSNQDGVGFGE